MPSKVRVLFTLLCLCLADPGAAGSPARLHDMNGSRLLEQALGSTGFWSTADVDSYKGELFDEIRMKKLEGGGYLCLISGEGSQDFDIDIVAETVFNWQYQIQDHMEGVVDAIRLGAGFDRMIGAEYVDTFFLLDFDFFYSALYQRTYKTIDAEGRMVMWFEQLDAGFVDAATWARYQAQGKTVLENFDRRWPPLDSVVPVEDLYGLFIVEPGDTHRTRVTMINKLTFSSDESWIASIGSGLTPVVKLGLKHGFEASVAVARVHQRQRAAGQ